MLYEVVVEEILRKTIAVNAVNRENARLMVEKIYEEEKIDMSLDDCKSIFICTKGKISNPEKCDINLSDIPA